jgi:hypothetical protein
MSLILDGDAGETRWWKGSSNAKGEETLNLKLEVVLKNLESLRISQISKWTSSYLLFRILQLMMTERLVQVQVLRRVERAVPGGLR